MATYKVVENINVEEYGVKLGDKCDSRPSLGYDAEGCCFYSKEWAGDGIWFLRWEQVRKVEE